MFLSLRLGLLASFTCLAQSGIPISDPTVIAKCGACHKSNAQGIMARVSVARSTPEGWQNVLKQMVLRHDMEVTPEEARAIVRYLSSAQGLAPEEAKPLMYGIERRIRDEQTMGTPALVRECGRCHTLASTMSWRRPARDWQEIANTHAAQYKIRATPEALAELSKKTELETPEWKEWTSKPRTPQVTGRWLIRANVPGRGPYVGELAVTPSGNPDEFNTRAVMKSVRDGSIMQRTGRAAVYTGYAWRGRSKGSAPAASADDPAAEVREVMWIAPDQSKAEGRWYWGQYQEFGFDVQLQRPTEQPTILQTEPAAIKTGTETTRVRILGDHFPTTLKPTDLNFGAGVTVKSIASQSANEVVVDIAVAADAPFGKREVTLATARVPFTIYDRIDYIRVTPESALAAFSDSARPRGYEQFEAVGIHRGPDGREHTPDDLELNPVDVNWSFELFYAAEKANLDVLGKLSPGGLFTPAVQSTNNNYDVWVIATAKTEKEPGGEAMVGKSYLVLTVPMYTLNGRRYIRDLDRWVDDGPVKENQ
ncbi:MAG: quinohemoprotein amine dehydrogenase subunit alpha [Bryobacteraceae bacterium]